MKLPVGIAISMFQTSLNAEDVSGSYDADRFWQEAPPVSRTLKGVFQPANDKDLAFAPEGFVTAGAMVLHTKEPVSYVDLNQGGPQGDQTYILQGGEKWRVKAQMDWTINGSYNRYLCEKYLDNAG